MEFILKYPLIVIQSHVQVEKTAAHQIDSNVCNKLNVKLVYNFKWLLCCTTRGSSYQWNYLHRIASFRICFQHFRSKGHSLSVCKKFLKKVRRYKWSESSSNLIGLWILLQIAWVSKQLCYWKSYLTIAQQETKKKEEKPHAFAFHFRFKRWNFDYWQMYENWLSPSHIANVEKRNIELNGICWTVNYAIWHRYVCLFDWILGQNEHTI